jgi:hypothetical protein
MKVTYRLLPVLLALPMTMVPAEAVEPQEKPAPPAVLPETEEVIVTGRRNGEPDFQEQQEYHDQEYRRLKQIYDPDPPAIPRSDRLTRMPEAASSTVQGKPTLTERF